MKQQTVRPLPVRLAFLTLPLLLASCSAGYFPIKTLPSPIVNEPPPPSTPSPRPASLPSGASRLSVAYSFACAEVQGGVQCWGDYPKHTAATSPEPVTEIIAKHSGATSVATLQAVGPRPDWFPVGGTTPPVGAYRTPLYSTACAVVDGGVKCFGSLSPQTSSASDPLALATLVSPGSKATMVSIGRAHSEPYIEAAYACAVVNGGVRCWGGNYYGTLGNGNNLNSPTAVPAIPAGSGVESVSAGDDFACAVARGGVKCWGRNTKGQLGNGGTNDSWTPVETLPEGAGATSIVAGPGYACAVVQGGVKCWGWTSAYGQIGNGKTGTATSPVTTIPAGSGISAVSLSGDHACALGDTGLQCWGYNAGGQLGDGTYVSSAFPIALPTPSSGAGVTSLVTSTDPAFSCATVNGRLQCWGLNYGQFGDGTTGENNLPSEVAAWGEGITDLATDPLYSTFLCAMSEDTVQCSGANHRGQLGDGTTTDRTSPVTVQLR